MKTIQVSQIKSGPLFDVKVRLAAAVTGRPRLPPPSFSSFLVASFPQSFGDGSFSISILGHLEEKGGGTGISSVLFLVTLIPRQIMSHLRQIKHTQFSVLFGILRVRPGSRVRVANR